MVLEFSAFALGIIFALTYLAQLSEMRKATIAATQATKDTRDFFKTDERAWVVIRVVPLKSYPDPQAPLNEWRGVVKFGFSPKNLGKTIARNVRMHVDGVTDSKGTPAMFGPQTLAPGEEADNSFVRPGTVLQDKFTGRIDYIDAFDVSHWATFCYMILDNKGTTEQCGQGNQEDTNPER